MLKHQVAVKSSQNVGQPPSGGCVLKPLGAVVAVVEAEPAAFGRLCVET